LSESNIKKEVIVKIQKWLDEESIKFSVVEEPYSDFRLDIKNPNQTILSFTDKPDSVLFITHVSLTLEDKKAFAALENNEEKFKILWDLERSLIEINVGYVLLPNQKNLDKVEISKKIYFDGLTKDKFMDIIFALQRGLYLVELMLRQLGGKYYSNSTTTFIL